MKTLILILTLAILTSCMKRDQTVVGTIVSIENRGYNCPRSYLSIQPAGSALAGNLIHVEVPESTDDKKALIKQYLNKSVKLTIKTEEHFLCATSTLEIADLK